MAFATLDRATTHHPALPYLKAMRRLLDAAYRWAGYLAAAAMMTVLLITLAQMVTRYAHITVTGLSDYAGYFMAASTFLALAHTLNRGVHVRIELLTSFAGRFRYHVDILAFGCGAAIAGWFSWYACRMVWWSWKFNDISTGLDATPLWIPQISMAAGSALFTVAIVDQLFRLILTGAHTVPVSESLE